MATITSAPYLVRFTEKFSCFSLRSDGPVTYRGFEMLLDINCEYTARIVDRLMDHNNNINNDNNSKSSSQGVTRGMPVQVKDFENIDWDPVMAGKHIASSFLVRKGLSRKAQLALQLRRYCSKNPDSILKSAVPLTVIVDTWSAFEEMKLDFGGISASFDLPELSNAPLRQKLDWCLGDPRMFVLEDPLCKDWTWILKPSVTNKVNLNCSHRLLPLLIFSSQLFESREAFTPILAKTNLFGPK